MEGAGGGQSEVGPLGQLQDLSQLSTEILTTMESALSDQCQRIFSQLEILWSHKPQ